MKKLNIKDIEVKFNEYGDASRITFETKDGTPVDWIEIRDFAGFVTDDDAYDMVQADILSFWTCVQCIDDIYGEDEKTWEAEANKHLEDLGVKLGAYHTDGEYYDLQTI